MDPYARRNLMSSRPGNAVMPRGLISAARITIDTPVAVVWNALVNPEVIKRYMFGTTVVSDWKVGGSIRWKGTWNGRAYEDKGTILEFKPNRVLSYSHFSPLSGDPDLPQNYHTVTIELSRDGGRTVVSLSQDNNPTEEAKRHSDENWKTMLAGLKKLLETKQER